MARTRSSVVQYWLAELDQHGNPTLTDGPHSNAEGANQAAYLIEAMHLGQRGRSFAVARVELFECVPTSKGVNHEAVRLCREAVDRRPERKGA